MKYEKKTQTGTETGTGAGTGTGRKTEAGREPRRPAGKAAALAMAVLLAVAGAAVYAEGEEGSWTLGGWSRANFGWDFQNETQLGKPDGDWDATGAEATLTYTKGNWKVAGTATVTSPDFGTTYGASGNVTATYTAGDWTASGKLAQTFNADGQGEWVDISPTTDSDGDGDPENDKDFFTSLSNYGRTAQFSVENWKQDTNIWGFKGIVQLKLDVRSDWPIPVYDPASDDNKAAFFINFWDNQILLEGGYGDYTDNQWTTPGPYEIQYESADDEDSALRVQFKFVPGLNFGFAYLPGLGHTGVNAGLADSLPKAATDSTATTIAGFGSWKPVDALRATSFGVKYAPTDSLLVLAAGVNLKQDAEQGYAGFSYKFLNKQVTLFVDGQGQHDSGYGIVNLGEKITYVDNPDETDLELGLSLKQNRLIRSSGGTSAKDFEFVASPYVWYEFIDKIARAKLALDLTKGLGEVNEDHFEWLLTTTLGWSLKETPAFDPDDIGTGFVVKYKAGVAEDPYTVAKGVTTGKTTTNQLYVGFKVLF